MMFTTFKPKRVQEESAISRLSWTISDKFTDKTVSSYFQEMPFLLQFFLETKKDGKWSRHSIHSRLMPLAMEIMSLIFKNSIQSNWLKQVISLGYWEIS